MALKSLPHPVGWSCFCKISIRQSTKITGGKNFYSRSTKSRPKAPVTILRAMAAGWLEEVEMRTGKLRDQYRTWFRIGMILSIAGGAGCGDDADFSGSTRQSANLVEAPVDDGTDDDPGVVEPPVQDPVEIDPYASLTWHWQCDTAPGANRHAMEEDMPLVAERA